MELLEKRVRSRFSQRTVHVAGPATDAHWLDLTRRLLLNEPDNDPVLRALPIYQRWFNFWSANVTVRLITLLHCLP